MILELYIGQRSTGVSVRTDATWPTMWRVHQGDRVSDIVNLTRAKDAAVAWARPRGLGGTEIPRWHLRETAGEATPARFSDAPYVRQPPEESEPGSEPA